MTTLRLRRRQQQRRRLRQLKLTNNTITTTTTTTTQISLTKDLLQRPSYSWPTIIINMRGPWKLQSLILLTSCLLLVLIVSLALCGLSPQQQRVNRHRVDSTLGDTRLELDNRLEEQQLEGEGEEEEEEVEPDSSEMMLGLFGLADSDDSPPGSDGLLPKRAYQRQHHHQHQHQHHHSQNARHHHHARHFNQRNNAHHHPNNHHSIDTSHLLNGPSHSKNSDELTSLLEEENWHHHHQSEDLTTQQKKKTHHLPLTNPTSFTSSSSSSSSANLPLLDLQAREEMKLQQSQIDEGPSPSPMTTTTTTTTINRRLQRRQKQEKQAELNEIISLKKPDSEFNSLLMEPIHPSPPYYYYPSSPSSASSPASSSSSSSSWSSLLLPALSRHYQNTPTNTGIEPDIDVDIADADADIDTDTDTGEGTGGGHRQNDPDQDQDQENKEISTSVEQQLSSSSSSHRQQVPEQLPIVVSSSDNSYVSASPIETSTIAQFKLHSTRFKYHNHQNYHHSHNNNNHHPQQQRHNSKNTTSGDQNDGRRDSRSPESSLLQPKQLANHQNYRHQLQEPQYQIIQNQLQFSNQIPREILDDSQSEQMISNIGGYTSNVKNNNKEADKNIISQLRDNNSNNNGKIISLSDDFVPYQEVAKFDGVTTTTTNANLNIVAPVAEPHYSKIVATHHASHQSSFRGPWHDSRIASIRIGKEEYNDYGKGGLNSAIIAIMFGIGVTGMLIVIVGHKMKSIRKRLAYKGRRRSLVPDADFLINTMPI